MRRHSRRGATLHRLWGFRQCVHPFHGEGTNGLSRESLFDGLIAVAAVLIASGLGFSNLQAKTADYFFTGWPSYWNLVALYCLAWHVSTATTTVLLIVLAVLVFVPLRYVYPSRTVTLMRTTNGLGVLWGIQMLLMIWWLPNVPAWLLWSSPIYPVYYFALSLWLNVRSSETTDA